MPLDNISNRTMMQATWYFNSCLYLYIQYDENEKTLMTFILYLSEGFEGGETVFFPGGRQNYWTKPDPKLECKVKPKIGTALIFFQCGEFSPLHEGAPHISPGMYKYILRSDLAYTRL